MNFLLWIKLQQIMLYKVTKTMIEWRDGAVASLDLIQIPWDGALILLGNQLYLLHLILFIQELLYEILVRGVPVVQRFNEILFEHIFKLSQLVKLLVLKLLQLETQSISQVNEMVP